MKKILLVIALCASLLTADYVHAIPRRINGQGPTVNVISPNSSFGSVIRTLSTWFSGTYFISGSTIIEVQRPDGCKDRIFVAYRDFYNAFNGMFIERQVIGSIVKETICPTGV